jgi:hypothetical protein
MFNVVVRELSKFKYHVMAGLDKAATRCRDQDPSINPCQLPSHRASILLELAFLLTGFYCVEVSKSYSSTASECGLFGLDPTNSGTFW